MNTLDGDTILTNHLELGNRDTKTYELSEIGEKILSNSNEGVSELLDVELGENDATTKPSESKFDVVTFPVTKMPVNCK